MQNDFSVKHFPLFILTIFFLILNQETQIMSLGIEKNIGLFLISGIIIWIASNRLSAVVEYIDQQFNLGDAFGGTIMLAIATNLPETVIVIRGVQQGDNSLALGNILGGIALQTLLLVLFDYASRNERTPLSSLTYHRNSILQGLFLCIILGLVIMGAQFQPNFVDYPISPIEILIALSWLISLYLLKQGEKSKMIPKIEDRTKHKLNTNQEKALWELLGLAILITFFGVILANTSESISQHFEIDGVIFGATILSLVTSLPEISGGLAFVRAKKYIPIISDIFGGNSFLPTLFLLANILAGRSIMVDAHKTDIYLVGLSIVLTLLFIVGMLMQSPKRFGKLGLESWVMLIVYLLAIIGLWAI